ncbi:MAG: peptidoglycan-binding domain-containing protein [Hasllibacter sp.]
MAIRGLTALVSAAALAGCLGARPPAPGSERGPEVRRAGTEIAVVAPRAPAPITLHAGLAPPGADPALCWSREHSPARVVIETVQAREGGVLVSRTRQRIEAERREVWFESPCPPAMTEAFVASLQRALTARGLYEGPIDGRMSQRTRLAVRAYQDPLGLPSGTLSMEAARSLGLAPVPRD